MDEDFYDHFEHTIDAKGRLVLPAAYRDAFQEGGYVTRLGRYVAMFTVKGWERYKRKIDNDSSLNRLQKQMTYSLISEISPDSQHRIAVNRKLREMLGLGKEVTLVGSGSHVAIYPRDVWAGLLEEALRADETGMTYDEKIDALGFL